MARVGIPGAAAAASVVLVWVMAQGCGGAEFTSGSGQDAAMSMDSPASSDSTGGDQGDVADSAAPQDSTAPQDGTAAQDGAPPAKCDGIIFQCVPDVPTNWSGPLEVAAVTGSASLPASCEARFSAETFSGYEGLVAPPATCQCTCGTEVASCAYALTFYDVAATAQCTSTPACYAAKLADGVCTTLAGPPSCSSVVGAPSASAPSATISASCPATPTTSKQATSWMGSALGCLSSIERTAADCVAGDICAPSPGGAFGAKLCIEQAGNVACPSTGYTNKTVYYANQTPLDGRTCSSCACEGSGASCFNEAINVYPSSDGSCSGMPDTYLVPFTCDPVSANLDTKYTASVATGSCTVSTPSVATGAATPINPFTVCCLP